MNLLDQLSGRNRAHRARVRACAHRALRRIAADDIMVRRKGLPQKWANGCADKLASRGREETEQREVNMHSNRG